jgi:hypothetical protein
MSSDQPISEDYGDWYDQLFGESAPSPELVSEPPMASDASTPLPDPVAIPSVDAGPSSSGGGWLDTLRSAGGYIVDLGKSAAEVSIARSRIDAATVQARAAADIAKANATGSVRDAQVKAGIVPAGVLSGTRTLPGAAMAAAGGGSLGLVALAALAFFAFKR